MPAKKPSVFLSSTFRCCENNAYLEAQVRAFFEVNGHEILPSPEGADVIVVETCAFDQTRESEALSVIGGLLERHPGKRVLILGCLPKINPVFNKDAAVQAIGPKELDRLDEIFAPQVPIRAVRAHALAGPCDTPLDPSPKDFYIQICQGCVNRCSYCAIKKAKGSVTSKTIPQILAEFEDGLRQGHRRFVLLADDCGSYGVDLGTDLAELLTRIDSAFLQPFELQIYQVEPGRLLSFYDRIPKSLLSKIYRMSIPIQTASPRLLSRMNRRYDIERVLGIARELTALNPRIELRTQILYAFPGETRRELAATCRVADVFSKSVYFFYTDRAGVPSSRLPGKVPRSEVMWRTAALIREKEKRPSIDFCSAQEGYQHLFRSIQRSIPVDKTEVLLIHPRTEEGAEPALPGGLLALAQPLIDRGTHVRILDARLEDDVLARVDEILAAQRTVCVGITCPTGPAISSVLEIARRVRSRHGVPVVLGGPHPSALPEETLRDESVDFIVRGEGGRSFDALVRALKSGRAPRGIPGVGWKARGKAVLPPAARGRRGAPSYAPYHLLLDYYPRYRARFIEARGDVDAILRGVRDLARWDGGQPEVSLLDDDFFEDPRRAGEFVARVIEGRTRGDLPGFGWRVKTRAQSLLRLEPRLVERLADGGLRGVHLEPDSGSPRTLRRLGLAPHDEELLRANRLLSRYRIDADYAFRVGFPSESEEDIGATTRLASALKKEHAGCRIALSRYVHHPGDPFSPAPRPGADGPSRLKDWASAGVALSARRRAAPPRAR